VTRVFTDNAKNMEKMRDGLKKDDPSLVVYGLSAHNLLGQDITPSMMKYVVLVETLKYFQVIILYSRLLSR